MTDPAPKAKIPNNCVWEDTFWESDRFLSYALHFLTSIEIPLHCFGAYLIIFKTPKTMKTAKFSILQLHIVCAVMDLMITSLWAFYLWWPCPAGYPVGLMSSLGVDSTLQTFIVLNVMLAYNNLLMIAIGCNGLFTTLVMILVHHPYRKAVCEIIATRRLNGLNATAQPLRSFIINRHVAMIPCPAGYPVGLMSSIGIDSTLQSFIAQTVMLAVAISYISLFENRYDVVVVGRVGRSKRRNLYRAIFFLLNIIYVESTLGYIYYHLPEKEDARAHVHKLQPCIPMAMINHPNFMDLNAGSYTIPFVSGSMVVIICIQAIYFLGYTTYCLFTNVQNVSNHTRKVQKKFFLAMFLQAAIPAVSFAAPLYGYSLLYKFDYFDQMYNNLLMIAIGCNGLFSTVAMILVHHPYRNAALDMIRMRKLNGLNSAIGTFNLRPIITEKNLVVVSG
ncbi:unnamed protein product [Caenorhabditis brenneri]